MSAKNQDPKKSETHLVLNHLRFGWIWILVFLSLGILLEVFHGFKVGWYLDVSNDTRRLMWRLAHAHGTFLGLVHIAFALTAAHFPNWNPKESRTAGALLTSASALIPGGFFLGGVWIHGGDPGIGIILLPVGAVLLFAAVWTTLRAAATKNL